MRHIVLITVDTLRADHMSLYGYARPTTPELERWFPDDRAAIYERAYATETSTSPSVVSFLSGLLPQEHRVRLLHQLLPEQTRLVTDLLPEPFETAAFVSNAVLADEAIGMAARFDHYDDFVDEQEPNRFVFERRADRTTDAALAWVALREDRTRPLFLWVHYIDPHGPYAPPPEWPRRFHHDAPVPIDTRGVPRYVRIEGEDDARVYEDLYDEEIAYTDREVGRLLDGLEGRLGLDASLVIFSADHGESLIERDRYFTHGFHVYEELALVPLMLRGPGVEPGRSAAPVSGIDLAPTLLRFAGVAPPATIRGADLRRRTAMSPQRVVLVEASDEQRQVRAILRERQKAMVRISPKGEIEGWAFYDLAEDPGETRALPNVTDARLRATLQEMVRRDPDPGGFPSQYREGAKLAGPKVAPGVEGVQLERLRALGYAD